MDGRVILCRSWTLVQIEYLDKYYLDCHGIWKWHSLSPEDKSCWQWNLIKTLMSSPGWVGKTCLNISREPLPDQTVVSNNRLPKDYRDNKQHKTLKKIITVYLKIKILQCKCGHTGLLMLLFSSKHSCDQQTSSFSCRLLILLT